jgi:hypothetical protein
MGHPDEVGVQGCWGEVEGMLPHFSSAWLPSTMTYEKQT